LPENLIGGAENPTVHLVYRPGYSYEEVNNTPKDM